MEPVLQPLPIQVVPHVNSKIDAPAVPPEDSRPAAEREFSRAEGLEAPKEPAAQEGVSNVQAQNQLEAGKNGGESVATGGGLIEEPVAKQAVTEGRLQPTDDVFQGLSSNGIDKMAEGIFVDRFWTATNSMAQSLQHNEVQNHSYDNMEINEVSSDDKSSEEDSDSNQGNESDKELGNYYCPSFEELENARPPEVGMKFPTLEDAQRFFDAHALKTGFCGKRGTNYMRKKFTFECHRSGKSKLTPNPKRKRKRNIIERTECKAKVIVKLSEGQWEFTSVRNEHNHPMCLGTSLKRFLRRKQLRDQKQLQVQRNSELMTESNILDEQVVSHVYDERTPGISEHSVPTTEQEFSHGKGSDTRKQPATQDEGYPVQIAQQPMVHGEKDCGNDGETVATSGNLIEEQSSNGIEKTAEGLDVDKLGDQTNSMQQLVQYTEQQNQSHDNMESNEVPSDTSSESDSNSSSGSDCDKELGKYFYPSLEDMENSKPPELGMKFPSLEAAHRFYNTYALLSGFTGKRGTNYKRKKFHLGCNKGGKAKLTKNVKTKRKNAIDYTQCKARVIVKLNKGEWEFTAVRNEHNHPLCLSRSLTKFFLNHKNMAAEEKSFLRVLQQSKIPPKKVMKIFRKMKTCFRQVPFENKGLSKLLCAEQRTANSDVESALKYFTELQIQNPGFFYTMQTDDDNTVGSVFWTDARSRMDYDIFGDFILFDTTFSTDRYNMPFVPIIGINNHGRPLLLGCALLKDDQEETFKWMLHTFLQVMGGKVQRAIITCQHTSMENAIADVMAHVRLRICKRHVMRKAQEKLRAFMAARGDINADLNSLVDNSLTEMEFEEGWAELIERYDASENQHLQLMWETRKNWVPVYFKEDFYPFVESIGCCEGTNTLFKTNMLPKETIDKFIEKYKEIQEKIRKMDEEDRFQSGTDPKYISMQPIEQHAGHMYTREIFLKVQNELLHSTAFNVQEIETGTVYRLEKVFCYDNPEFDRNTFEVLVELSTNAFKCQCAKFTRDGILCCHIFRLFTQLGISEIPEQYKVPRWTQNFREEQLKQYKEKNLEMHGIDYSENTLRYAMIMSKVADIGREICFDSAMCNRFMLEIDKIQEKLAAEKGENLTNNDGTSEQGPCQQ